MNQESGAESRLGVRSTRMHAEQVVTDVNLVRALLEDQFPQWARLPVTPVSSFGTDHDIYRLGDHLSVRLPCIEWATAQAQLEAAWLPRLAPKLPLSIPEQIAIGEPAKGYPFTWSIYKWLPGEEGKAAVTDLSQAATDLAAFIHALRRIQTTEAPSERPCARGGALFEVDEPFRSAIAKLGDRIDGHRALDSWQESLDASPWTEDPVWVHGDLLPGNLLFVDGRLSAIIDFGCLNVGDPACDLLPAWNLFTGNSRSRFRTELEVDEASWLRGRGWALYQAVVALPYYWETNQGIVRQASSALQEMFSESGRTTRALRAVPRWFC